MLCLKMIFGSQRCEAPDLPSSSSSSNERLFPPPPGVILDAPPPEGAPILAASYKFEEKLLVKRENRKTEGLFVTVPLGHVPVPPERRPVPCSIGRADSSSPVVAGKTLPCWCWWCWWWWYSEWKCSESKRKCSRRGVSWLASKLCIGKNRRQSGEWACCCCCHSCCSVSTQISAKASEEPLLRPPAASKALPSLC